MTRCGFDSWLRLSPRRCVERRRSRRSLDKVTFGTNWVAQAEHGGFYQALADGTYKKYGLDVTILPGGPNSNNRILLPVGKIDFYMSANLLQSFDAVEQNVPTVAVAASFQKDPQVFLAHPDQGIEKFEDLKKLTLLVSKEGLVGYYQWLKKDYGFTDKQVRPYTFNPQPFLADKRMAMQGYVTSEPYRGGDPRQVQAEDLPARRSGLLDLFDPDRDAARSGREEARSRATLRRCLGDRLGQLHLRRQQGRECADQEAESGNDRRADRLFDREDEGIRHRRFRRLAQARHRRDDRCARQGFLRQDGAGGRGEAGRSITRRPIRCNSSTRASASICGRSSNHTRWPKQSHPDRPSFRCAASAKLFRTASSPCAMPPSISASANSSRCSALPAAASRRRFASSPG